ncbi:related to 2-polyprenyl-6-methoxyphenol hydroxylase and related FAD-dependent oxidoreductases [Ramularia collo-cygni]|uniref:Related to 2-polyprenyl-6-methoxyphenol hydroxylase and related FAD-dependent oxidoreductases n=1 Tax=Ramularia collo-cygni TaxID=112498 RepID=A0A2D3UPA1_9PEZI|nr:related to 2-polyprenyl-6-methoxyphenol hydroxylase and related FAD-dependent oxidoreductases [Ramularia collo-cygni]CZT18282.1 related to 2-polyprenyl-6-methoxyphenol hydroxylase and related FAD-dependent oxidoreductases [Ramularia collo-cygni]
MIDKGFRIYNVDGVLVNEIPLATRDIYGADRMMYHRQDLHDCLKEAARSTERDGPPVTIKTSSRVLSCDCKAGTIKLKSGEEICADLIIGADGIHSTIRSHVLDERVSPVRTGLSAYRMMISSDLLEERALDFCRNINPREAYTSMLVAHQCRLIMGPAREGSLYSIVGLVPDEMMHEPMDERQSWRSQGDLSKLLETYKDFPEWVKAPFKLAEDIGLWQLRDIPPLQTWTKGRVILIGDAAHAMLPTQGQGASQAIEDAEALGAFFEGSTGTPSAEKIESILQQVFRCRYERASLIQRYSRDAAKPATEKGSSEVKMRPDEFMEYNCSYKGAKDWEGQMSELTKV